LKEDSDESTLFPRDFHARTFPWPESVRGWLESGADCGGRSIASLLNSLPVGFSSKTSLAFYRPGAPRNRRRARWNLEPSVTEKRLKDGRKVYVVSGTWKRRTILRRSSLRWGNSAIGGPLGFSTLNTSESRSGGGASSLSDILERGPIPQKYFLTAQACRGILRRARRRGKKLPGPLEAALKRVAGEES